MSWKLNNTPIPKPDEFSTDPDKKEVGGRTASGRLRKRIIAKKWIFNIGYKGLPAPDVAVLGQIYSINRSIPFEYEDEGTTKTKMVWFSVFSKRRLLTKNEYYQVSMVLEEE